MVGRPQREEAAPYFFSYIDQVSGDDPLALLQTQLEEQLACLAPISREKSLSRYAPGKWSIRQVLNHVTDTERAFAFRALWFGRGFTAPLHSYEQETGVAGAEADRISWAAHVEEFRRVRLATISLFTNMPPAGWTRTGTASGNHFTVRALAFIIIGHVEHHAKVIRERYLSQP